MYKRIKRKIEYKHSLSDRENYWLVSKTVSAIQNICEGLNVVVEAYIKAVGDINEIVVNAQLPGEVHNVEVIGTIGVDDE